MNPSHRALLLETTDTILQMARIARSQDTKPEDKIFYSHLASYCMRIKCHATSWTEMAADPHGGLISQTLGHLGTLFPEVCLFGTSTVGFMSFVQAHLTSINKSWNEIYKHNEHARHGFIQQWLRSAMPTPQRLALELALESCADEFEKHQTEPKSSLPLSLFKPSTHNEPSYTVHKAAHSIFNALRSCNRCACSCQHSFDAKLELGTYRKPNNTPKKRTPFRTRPKSNAAEDESADVDFDMFLSTDQDWHEIRIQAVKSKAVSFAPVGNADSTMPPHEHSSSSDSSGKIDTLCMPIHKKKDKLWQRLVLKMNKEELFEKGFEKSNFQVDSSVEPISLAQCLTQHREYFTEKTRRILSLILGYTVLHLHGTPWLAPGWDSTSVKFFQTTSSKTPLRPFIQTKLPTNNPTSDIEIHICDTNTSLSEIWCELDMRHCCPVVISLAVMLLEIHFARPFTELAKKYNVELTSLPGAPISPLDLHQVFNGDEEEGQLGAKSEIPEDSALVKAIENCLDDSLWEDEDRQPLDNTTLRSRIYQEIVSLLELHLTKGFSQIPLDSIDQCARDLDFGKWGLNVAGRENANESRQSLVQATPVPNLPLPAHYSLSVAAAAANSTAQTLWNTAYFYQGAPNPTQYAISNPGSLPIPEYDYRESQFFDDQIAGASTADTTKYLSWKDEYVKVYEKFISKGLDSHLTGAIKVAILDTGIDRNHDLIDGREENIRGKYNLYDPPRKTVKDENGHGTFITSLILDYAPDAELYIIKITGKANASPDGNVVAQVRKSRISQRGLRTHLTFLPRLSNML
ncbi:hypothetical protein VHEMI09042 [[Torrubiella] hemipterigena]|uniref:Uncharacterized protein n=1 Tax=[Torrubiella] hemipterigena TaxID=1531966 RepID=A0A0A1TFA5_9HYPO|nr:hypothetical protein VHEMI09042 [[Torrubiella] hemipterigena]